MASKASLLKGTRDFGPEEVEKRNFIFGIIRSVFEKYGFRPLETPAMEKIETLTDKYGEEGDQLLFRVLNNGDFLAKVNEESLIEKDSKSVRQSISKRGLRYDLTVPFARYVGMNQHDLNFPFKRYQIQPVWRADRPQKGRYQEFYQCDVDVIGSNGLASEAELILIYDEVFSVLGLEVEILFNSRKILTGISQILGIEDRMTEMTMSIDKWDKIGETGVKEDLIRRGFQKEKVEDLIALIKSESSLRNATGSQSLEQGFQEIDSVHTFLESAKVNNDLVFDPKLARGLNYYTGIILEVKAKGATIGSIGGGGRYDNLGEAFGLRNLSGVGISFGVERIYDIMSEMGSFPDGVTKKADALILAMDEESLLYGMNVATDLRRAGLAIDLYPSCDKFKKLMKYANGTGIQNVIIIGEQERESEMLTVKDMISGNQESISVKEIQSFLDK